MFSSYNGPAFAFFSFVAMLLQLPLIYAYSRGKLPNIPVAVMASWFFYINLRGVITSISWTGDDIENWWAGAGWCDIDVRLLPAASTGIMLAQLAINCRLIEMFGAGARRRNPKLIFWRNAIDLAICFVIPVVTFVLWTFLSYSRYVVVQYMGCFAMPSMSAPTFIFGALLLPLFSLSSTIMIIVVLILIWRRGRQATFETVRFTPRMNPGYFVRTTLFSIIVTCVVLPLSLYVFANNIIATVKSGFTAIAWLHGKPAGWDSIGGVSMAVGKAMGMSNYIEQMMLVMVCLLVLSYFMFICYGTGSIAQELYRDTLTLLRLKSIRDYFWPSLAEEEESSSIDWVLAEATGTPTMDECKFYTKVTSSTSVKSAASPSCSS